MATFHKTKMFFLKTIDFMEKLLRFLASHRNSSLQIQILDGKKVRINGLNEIDLQRKVTAQELADWCEYQKELFGGKLPSVIIIERTFAQM